MRFLITAGPGENSKMPSADEPFDEQLFAAYMKFNEDLHKAGVLVASEGLSPSVQGAKIEVKNGKRQLIDGPFTEAKELLGGIFLIEVKSREEAIEWALRCPHGAGFDDVLQIYPMTQASDIPENLLQLIAKVAPTWFASLTKER